MHSLFDPKNSSKQHHDLQDLHHKVFNISVIGLSGVEKDKGPIGIGKSCLCNRFIRSAFDDYYTDHISVLSQSDFGGRVVNNDHWLYWGSVIKSCDGVDLAFNVIEQTEFVDDACFQPFKSGKTEPYYKRCAATKLVSPEKLMYICKGQLGVEREYEVRYLPDGKFNVDGFLCLFDVSDVQGRSIEKQVEMTNFILFNIIKTKKPVVLVTTKHDEANELLIARAIGLVNQREFRGMIPIVETSAQENVNINTAFLTCAQLIDRVKSKLRILPYLEALKNHRELLRVASDAYMSLIRSTVIDWRNSWQQVCIKLSHNPEFLQYTYLHGLDKAIAVYKNHIKKLKNECIDQKVQVFMKLLPDILNELLTAEKFSNNNNEMHINPSDSSIENWHSVKISLRSHPKFETYFIQLAPDISWTETELLHSAEVRIPFDWLESEEAYAIFREWTMQHKDEERKQYARELFSRVLEDSQVPVGKPFVALKYLFADNQNFASLSDQDLFDIYVDYQNNLLQKARADFQELLLENAEHLHHLTSSNKIITQEDIKTINTVLQHDERYQALDDFEQDRTLMIIRHLSFLHSQISEQCPSHPSCIEPEVERLLIMRAKSIVNRYVSVRNSSDKFGGNTGNLSKSIDLVIIGPRRPSQQLILALNVLNSRAEKSSQYQISFTVLDNSCQIDSQAQRFFQSSIKSKGCLCIFTNSRSLEHVSQTLEQFVHFDSQNEKREKGSAGTTPIVILYAADITLVERTMLLIENEGQQLADRFRCPFINVTAIDQYRQHQQNSLLTVNSESSNQVISECASLDYTCVDGAFSVLKESISRYVCFVELYTNQDLIPKQAFDPDVRILMCLLCGEPFSIEAFLWLVFLSYEDCFVISSKSICLKVKGEGGDEKYIEIIISSYTHGAFNYREDLLHGFILVCSDTRPASLAILNAFSFNIPCTPVQILAVHQNSLGQNNLTGTTSSDASDSANQILLDDAQSSARRLKGYFETIDLDKNSPNVGIEQHLEKIMPFLKSVLKRKSTIERAYELGDADETPTSDLTTSSNLNNDGISFKPVPGKLDLSQFDNITNAIKKLNVQPTMKLSEVQSNAKKSPQQAESVQEKMFFKNKSKKSKAKIKESLKKASKSSTTAAEPTSSIQANRDEIESSDSSKFKCEQISHESPASDNNEFKQNLHQLPSKIRNIDDSLPAAGQVADQAKPTRFNMKHSKFLPNSCTVFGTGASEVSSLEFGSSPKDQPKPAPRSAIGVTKQNSLGNNVSSFASQASRRITGVRQNHGIAVAPPQLPSNSFVSSLGNAKTESLESTTSDFSHVSSTIDQLRAKQSASDSNQSPIAQKLLMNSANHKVSELNSPSEYDFELTFYNQLALNHNFEGPGLASSSSALRASSIDTRELMNSRGATIRQLNEILANKQALNRQDGAEGACNKRATDNNNHMSKSDKEKEKKEKKLSRDDEKRRLKEEERLRRLDKKMANKRSKSSSEEKTNALGNDDGVPLFIERCIEFIELEGLDAEGIYRVPGNRAHVDAFIQKFEEDPSMSILDADIPVNAVATALKDFLSKKTGPIIPLALMNELTELSMISDEEQRISAIRQLIYRLPPQNYKLLKYVFAHFVRVSKNCTLNSMDSKNLAICWWPTLLPLHFSDMVMFEQMRPHLESSTQTMIDKFYYIFDTDEPAEETLSEL